MTPDYKSRHKQNVIVRQIQNQAKLQHIEQRPIQASEGIIVTVQYTDYRGGKSFKYKVAKSTGTSVSRGRKSNVRKYRHPDNVVLYPRKKKTIPNY